MISPMLASLAEAPLTDPALVYEPKYDGIRAIAEVGAGGSPVTLWSRLGNDKTSQFPEVARALSAWARRRREPVVLDGEIVALDTDGQPAGFQRLQGRIHVRDAPSGASRSASIDDSGRVAFIVFDVLEIGDRSLCEEPLTARRAQLERLFGKRSTPLLRISDQVRGDARALYEQAMASGWEGLIAKRADSKYKPGKRSPDWCKLKIVHEQEFVIGGWTEPRHTRSHFGALLLGVYDEGRLVYAGHTGTGFDQKELARVMALLKPLEVRECPFSVRPKSNERPHWVRPTLVAQVKFTEWTADGYLRHPVYLGLRDDKPARDVVREGRRLHASSKARLPGQVVTQAPAAAVASPKPDAATSRTSRTANAASATTEAAVGKARRGRADGKAGRKSAPAKRRLRPEPPIKSATRRTPDAVDALVEELRTLEDAHRDGVIRIPGGGGLAVTNLHKVFWPELGITKGDLFRYYAEVSPHILPVIADRALVMKRFPNGIHAKPFYQHRVQDAPEGVRVETVDAGARPQLVGGDLTTLLYTCQLAAISQDPWFSRVQTPATPDHVALDLDPSDDVPFAKVLDVARWIHDELTTLGVFATPKTSGASGLHIFIPLAPGTSYDAGLLFAQLVATLVAEKHPRTATIERAVRARGARVYVDYLQNIEGKTLASAYSLRASDFAGVSTPLEWKEVHEGVRREDFTIRTVLARLRNGRDPWQAMLDAEGVDLRSLIKGRPRR